MKTNIRCGITLLIAVLLFANVYGHDKSAYKPQKAIDSEAKRVASRNCIDSVIGTYYGWFVNRHDHYTDFNHTVQNGYPVADTAILLKRGDSVIFIQAKRILPKLAGFYFDTTARFRNVDNHCLAELSVFPEEGRITYSFGVGVLLSEAKGRDSMVVTHVFSGVKVR